MFSLLAKFAPDVLVQVAEGFLPGSGSVVRRIYELYRDTGEKLERAEIRQALQITEDKLNIYERVFVTIDRECGDLLDRVTRLEQQGKDSKDEITSEVVKRPELLAHFETIRHELDVRVIILEDAVRRLIERYASLADFVRELKSKQLTHTELADFRDFRLAKQLQAEGKFADSERILMELVKSHPNSVPVAVAQAVANRDNPAAFAEALGRAVRLRPGDDELKQRADAATVAVTHAPTSGMSTASTVRVPQVGDILDGWLLESRLGGGGWGIVYRATKNGQMRAVKVMRPELTRHDEFVTAFTDEVFNLLRLKHANIIAVERNGFCTSFQCHYFAMPLLDGANLEQHLERHGVPTADVAMGWLTGLLDGLEHAHAAGLIHRDIKPQNVMILPDGRAVMIDFGIAGLDGVPGYTQAIGVSREFAPHEQLSIGAADARADLFSLAATIFYALLYNDQAKRLAPEYEPELVPEPLRKAFDAALAFRRSKRPATAGAMRALLTTQRPPVHSRVDDWRTRCPACGSTFTFPPRGAGKHRPCPKLTCEQLLSLPLRDGEPAIVARPPRTNGDIFTFDLPQHVKMELIWCPPGSFLMGSPDSEMGRKAEERQHTVSLSKGFFVGIYPVTQAQYQGVMGNNPSQFKGPKLPVESVRWKDAMAFCKGLRELSGHAFRLPTEAEWEYAARGGTISPFYWGQELNGSQANCDGYNPYNTSFEGPYLGRTSPVGTSAIAHPHPWGLCDVHGNVWEWCGDWYDTDFYRRSPPVDPICRDDEQEQRCARGGSWQNHGGYCRAAYRIGFEPSQRIPTLGFRVVFSPQ